MHLPAPLQTAARRPSSARASLGRARERTPALHLLGLGLLVAVLACDSGVEPTLEPNVTALFAADVSTTDEGVMVGGTMRIDFGSEPLGIFVQHSTNFRYFGLTGGVNDELWSESWYMDTGRRLSTVRGDTTFYRSLDFGDVTLEGTPARRHVIDTVRVYETSSGVRVYENGILNRILIYSFRQNADGTTVTFTHEPWYEHMIGGGAIELAGTGSDEIAPFSQPVTLTPGARIESISQGEELDFQHRRPILGTDEPLVVELSRPLDPGRAYLRLFYVPPCCDPADPDLLDRARVVFELNHRTDRIVIPASALAELESRLPDKPERVLILQATEYLARDGALEIVHLPEGTPESLSSVQANHIRVYVEMPG